MVRKSILLFTRALIIGIILNVGLYIVSDPPFTQQADSLNSEDTVIGLTSNSD